MPLKASVGISKKVGQPDYGSLGANCQLDVELDASLIEDAEAFHEKIRRIYALACQAVNDQLATTNGNGHSGNGNGNGRITGGHNGDDRPDTLATNRQVKMINDLSRREGLSLQDTGQLCADLVGVNDPYKLTKRQASAVIDRLTGKNGNGRR